MAKDYIQLWAVVSVVIKLLTLKLDLHCYNLVLRLKKCDVMSSKLFDET
jgi:hypothetical protein